MHGAIDSMAFQRERASRLAAAGDIVVVPDRKWFVLPGGFRFDGRPIDFAGHRAAEAALRRHLRERNPVERERAVTVFVDADEEDVRLRGVVSGWTVFEIAGELRRCQLVVFEATSAARLARLGEHLLVDVPFERAAAWAGPSHEPKFGYDS